MQIVITTHGKFIDGDYVTTYIRFSDNGQQVEATLIDAEKDQFAWSYRSKLHGDSVAVPAPDDFPRQTLGQITQHAFVALGLLDPHHESIAKEKGL